MKKILKNFIFFPLIIIAAVAIVMMQMEKRQPIEHKDIQFPVKTVEVITVKKIPFRTRVLAYGNVEPATVLNAKSEVNGKISYIHPNLKKGGGLPKGTTVLKIDSTSFKISLDSSKAGLASSQSSLKQLEAEEASAKRSLTIAKKNLNIGLAELKRVSLLVKKGTLARNQLDLENQKVLEHRLNVQNLQGELNTFASRKASTRAQIKQSQSQVNQSKDTLVRTEVVLPFDARIGSVDVDNGQFITAGSQLFEAFGIEAVEIDAQLPIKQAQPLASTMNIDPNSNNSQHTGIDSPIAHWDLEAKVRIVGGNQSTVWDAKLVRLSESIDSDNDTLGMVVSVDKPYEGIIPGVRPPLLKGIYTSVEFLSKAKDMIVIPRSTLHQNRVYAVSAENTLEIRPVKVSYYQGQLAIIKEGIEVGDKIIVSDLVPVIEGTRLELIESDSLHKELTALASGTAL